LRRGARGGGEAGFKENKAVTEIDVGRE